MAVLIVDHRETSVIAKLTEQKIPYTVQGLDVGDFQIHVDGQLHSVWERKTYADLASSVKDSRYREQKLRLQACETSVKGYILEGHYNARCGLPESTIDSILLGLTVRDGFLLLNTTDQAHTARLLGKMLTKFPEYKIRGGEQTENAAGVLVKSHISVVKKDNYTPEICYLSQLAQLPQVSIGTARAIADAYPNMATFVDAILSIDGQRRLENIKISDRRLGRAIAERIIVFMKNETAVQNPTLDLKTCMLDDVKERQAVVVKKRL